MSSLTAQQAIDRLSASSAVDVVFVSTSPLNDTYPGGFARRHGNFARAVSEQFRAHVLYLAPPKLPSALFDEFPAPASVTSTTVRVDDDRHTLLPRHCVGPGLRWSGPTMVVPLTPNVAQLALSADRATVVLEEAWERALPASPRGWAERVLCARMYRRLGRAGHPVVAITDREATYFRRRLPNDVIAIPYGADAAWRADRQHGGHRVDVLVVGAVNRTEQQVEGFVRELRANAATQGATCAIVGGDPRPGIAALADEHTVVTGYVPEVRTHMAAARVVAVPTFTDIGIKTTVLQAWAAGAPVVTSHDVIGAFPDGARAAAVAVSSLREMAVAVGRLLADPDRAEALGVVGREVVATAFDAERASRTFTDLVARTLGRHTSGSSA
jgi:glycosyltransferase involved in cell wall biosynthesis